VESRLIALFWRISYLRAIVTVRGRSVRSFPLAPIAGEYATWVCWLIVRATVSTAIAIGISAGGSMGWDIAMTVLVLRNHCIKIESVDHI
jgi:hypothetical protein